MQETDFAPAHGFSRLDPPVFLGLDPTLLIGLILLLLAVAVGMYLLGQGRRGEAGGPDADRAAEEIHDAILKASQAAMSARSDQLLSRAETLRSVVADLLGPVLVIGNDVGKPIAQLTEALKGRGAAKDDHGKHDAHAAHAPVHADTARQPVTINQIYVGGAPATAEAHDHGHDGDHDHKPGHGGHDKDRDLTASEQIDAVSRAVRAFHDHWSRRPERIRELRAARIALSRRPPARLLEGSDGGRVWDRR